MGKNDNIPSKNWIDELDLPARSQELIQLEKLSSVGLLIAEIAHEVNNPISFLLSNTETGKDYFKSLVEYVNFIENVIFQKKDSSNLHISQIKKLRNRLKIDFILDDLPKLLDSNLKGLSRVRDVVSDLVVVSRSGDESKHNLIDIHESIDLVVNLLKHKLSKNMNIVKEYSVSPEYSKVLANPSKLDQIWVNLLLNAIQAIEEKNPSSGTITINTISEKDTILKVEIIDDGIGISSDNKHKIFHPFFTTKAPTKGTGLGLSICLRIVQEIGGAIGVFSEGEGKGTKVVVSFPITRTKE
ncbi:MAG: Sensor protein ZraS [Candidatus Heimdallarchaeota archaeon LC_3]|nr:MAG: Sensor protein ZraS [Candidatus Heimdallarchaeota archaeon LC_3]